MTEWRDFPGVPGWKLRVVPFDYGGFYGCEAWNGCARADSFRYSIRVASEDAVGTGISTLEDWIAAGKIAA